MAREFPLVEFRGLDLGAYYSDPLLIKLMTVPYSDIFDGLHLSSLASDRQFPSKRATRLLTFVSRWPTSLMGCASQTPQ
jgi:hypothetical protein